DKTAIVESDTISLPNLPLSESEHVEITDYSPSRVEIRSVTQTSRLIVLSDIYDENWHVSVDGTESTLYRVNYILRGVIVPEGSHSVEFNYSLMN
ncbi:MAG: YfhO family protein, partial [Candidatus Roizmanbacteria bacterium]|nr:YfhO family protein [Candidatus Roizmanbacteria bacterium]